MAPASDTQSLANRELAEKARRLAIDLPDDPEAARWLEEYARELELEAEMIEGRGRRPI